MQVDFNLPERFNVEYVDSASRRVRPFMIHRALLGSLERFFGVLLEHYAGAFPTWLAPVQAVILPITDEQMATARKRAKDAERLQKLGERLGSDRERDPSTSD